MKSRISIAALAVGLIFAGIGPAFAQSPLLPCKVMSRGRFVKATPENQAYVEKLVPLMLKFGTDLMKMPRGMRIKYCGIWGPSVSLQMENGDHLVVNLKTKAMGHGRQADVIRTPPIFNCTQNGKDWYVADNGACDR